MLILTRKKGESIIVNESIEINILGLSDGKVKIGIEAPKNVSIYRKEVHMQIQEENKKARNNKNIDLDALKGLIKKE